MKVVNRINTADANSQYINKVISSLSESHPSGLTVIQYVSDSAEKALENTRNLKRISNVNVIYVTESTGNYEILLQEADAQNTVILGSIEEAKVYIKYSHVIILDDHLTLDINIETLQLDHNNFYLTNIGGNNSIDASIYQQFLNDELTESIDYTPETVYR